MENNEFDQENQQPKKETQNKGEQYNLTRKDKQTELESILRQTEALTPQQLKEKNKKKEEEKFELQNGEFNSIKEVKDYKAAHRQPYTPHFGYNKPFYKNIYALNKVNGWIEEEHKRFAKRPEVAVWTMALIYARFGTDVLRHLRTNNPLLFAYIRKDKYFQYLTKEGQDKLDVFIDDFIRMSIGYSDWDKFEADYCAKYKLNRPQKLF